MELSSRVMVTLAASDAATPKPSSAVMVNSYLCGLDGTARFNDMSPGIEDGVRHDQGSREGYHSSLLYRWITEVYKTDM